VLHSPIDVDRLDYITRDNQMTGADVLSFDTDRMVESYTAHPEEGQLSDKALSAIGNYLEGRIALYMWVTQHHKSVYAHALLDDLLDELAAVADEPPVTTDAILAEGVDDNTIMERLRVAARDNPDSTLAALYDRFRGRRFPETCWKHRIAYADRVDAPLDDFSDWLAARPPRTRARRRTRRPRPRGVDRAVLRARVRATGTEGHPHRVRRHHALGRRLGLYGDRAFDSPIPFVFVPYGVEKRATASLVEWFHEERA